MRKAPWAVASIVVGASLAMSLAVCVFVAAARTDKAQVSTLRASTELQSPKLLSLLDAEGGSDEATAHEQRLAEFRAKVAVYRLLHPEAPLRVRSRPGHPRSWAQGVARGGSEAECLAQAVYYEARGESPEGQAAVAQVVLNRTRDARYPKSVCGVVFQGAGHPGCQFSFACEGSAQAASHNEAAWTRARAVAENAMSGGLATSVGGATHYHTDQVSPRWDVTLSKIAKIGRHIFLGAPMGDTQPPANPPATRRKWTWTSMVWG